jgi:hypothetical protein
MRYQIIKGAIKYPLLLLLHFSQHPASSPGSKYPSSMLLSLMFDRGIPYLYMNRPRQLKWPISYSLRYASLTTPWPALA